MGLLDALLSNDSGGGMFGGLPSSWQYKNPQDELDQKAFLAALQQDPSSGNNLVAPQSPFGPIPSFAQQPQSVFAGGASPINFNPAMLTPQQPQAMPPMQAAPQQAPPMAPQPAPPMSPQMAPQAAQDQPPSTVNVGGYQMPQFGSPSQVAQGGYDIGAQSRQPQPQAEAPQGLPPALGGMNNILGRIGNPDGLIARLTGNDSRSVAQQNLRAEYEATRQALMDNGLSAKQANSTAMLAVMNKDAGKVVLPELLSNKQKYGVISEDPLEGKKYGFINDREQTVNGQPLNSAGASSNGPALGLSATIDRIGSMRTAGATREELLKQIPTAYRDDVEALVTGKAVPANMGRAQIRGTLNILAHAVDKNYDEQMIPARVQMRKDFAGEGKNGQAIGAFNTVQHHAELTSDAIDNFEKAGGGSDYPLLNAGKLMLANNTGMNPKLRDASQKLQDELNATEHEVATAYNGGHISDTDRKTWQEIKASNLPANQLKQKLADFVELLNGKRDSLNHMYRATFGEDAPTIDKASNDAITAKIKGRLPDYSRNDSGGLPSGWSVKVR